MCAGYVYPDAVWPAQIDPDERTTLLHQAQRNQAEGLQGDGPWFLVKDYPKDKQWRQVKIPRHLVDKIKLHVARHGLALDELLFPLPVTEGSRRQTLPETLPDPETLGLTEPNEQGRQYPHGTLTAYQMGKCRCRHCKNAIAAYRATRRAAGIDQHILPGAGDAALKAMESYRASASTTAEDAATAKKKAKKKSKKKQQGELAEMKLMMAQMKDAMEAMRPGA